MIDIDKEVEHCIAQSYYAKTGKMGKAIGFGHRYLGFRFPGSVGSIIRETALLQFMNVPREWEVLVVNLIEHNEDGLVVDENVYNVTDATAPMLSEIVGEFLNDAQVDVNDTYLWLARPKYKHSLELISGDITKWFLANTTKNGAIVKPNFVIHELHGPAVNKMFKDLEAKAA